MAIDHLFDEQLSLRKGCRVKATLKMGRLLNIKPLAGFDFSFQPSRGYNRIVTLAGLAFIDRPEVVQGLGRPGCGKTHLAIASAAEAAEAGRGVCFTQLAGFIGSLAKTEREGTLRARIWFLCRPQLLVVDATVRSLANRRLLRVMAPPVNQNMAGQWQRPGKRGRVLVGWNSLTGLGTAPAG